MSLAGGPIIAASFGRIASYVATLELAVVSAKNKMRWKEKKPPCLTSVWY